MAPMMTSKTAKVLQFPVESLQMENLPKSESQSNGNKKYVPPKPPRSSKQIEQHTKDANIKIFTEKQFTIDFSKSTANDQCLLEIPLSTYGIGNISMEYHWNMKGILILEQSKNQYLFFPC